MQHDISDIRVLDDQELDAISGAATAWGGAKAVATIAERVVAHGVAIMLDLADMAVASYAKQV